MVDKEILNRIYQAWQRAGQKPPAPPGPRIEFHFSNGHVNFYRFDSDTDVQRWMVLLDKKIHEYEAALREERS